MESYRMEIIDFGNLPEKKKLEFKNYDIWVGYHHMGQGSDPSTKPEKLATIRATSFKIACCIYEHQSQINSLNERMQKGDTYIEDAHFGHWYYNPNTNSNSWLGKYYESEEEAWESF